MLSFQHRNILEKFDYNKKELSEDLDRRTAKFHAAERRYDTADKIRLPIADKIIAAPIRNMLRDAAKSQEQRMNDEWKSVYGAGYPWMKLANGTLEHAQHFLKENAEVLSESKDGWYHIPDAMCQSVSERNIRTQLEEECKQMGKQIPYEIGKQLETMFLQAKENHEQLWVHRTGLSIDGGDLASIAQRGLAVPTQGYGLDEKPQLEYTATRVSMDLNGFTHLLRAVNLEEYKQMRGVVICRTEEHPKIHAGYLQSEQVVGYVARDEHGHVCKFLEPSEMTQVHNTKTIMIDGKEEEIDRKSNWDMKEKDYRICAIPGFAQDLTLVNDAYNREPGACSIAYGNRMYGNLEAFAHTANLAPEQIESIRAEIQTFANELLENEHSQSELERKCDPEQEHYEAFDAPMMGYTDLDQESAEQPVKTEEKTLEKEKEEVER